MTTIGETGGIGLDASRTASRANLDKAGRQFEAVFTGMMLKSMRAARLAEPLFDSKALDTFRDMADQKVVATMAEAMPLGIGKAMTDFLAKSQAELGGPETREEAGSEGGAGARPAGRDVS